jgi:hypothetical protein
LAPLDVAGEPERVIAAQQVRQSLAALVERLTRDDEARQLMPVAWEVMVPLNAL